MTRHSARILLCLIAGAAACPAHAAPGEAPAPVPPPVRAEFVTPAAGPGTPPACGARAARYDDGKGFGLLATRAGEVRIENPLRPLTPEVTQVLQVVIAGKVATAYGADLAALRRGGAPAMTEAMLGGPIRWQDALPALPDPIAIVAEDGAPLARMAFVSCEAPPAVKAAPQAARKAPGRGGASRAADTRVPPGFSMPQGAIAQ